MIAHPFESGLNGNTSTAPIRLVAPDAPLFGNERAGREASVNAAKPLRPSPKAKALLWLFGATTRRRVTMPLRAGAIPTPLFFSGKPGLILPCCPARCQLKSGYADTAATTTQRRKHFTDNLFPKPPGDATKNRNRKGTWPANTQKDVYRRQLPETPTLSEHCVCRQTNARRQGFQPLLSRWAPSLRRFTASWRSAGSSFSPSITMGAASGRLPTFRAAGIRSVRYRTHGRRSVRLS